MMKRNQGRRWLIYCAITVLTSVAWVPASGSNDSELLETVIMGMRERCESIATWKGTVQTRAWHVAEDGDKNAEYTTVGAYDGNRIRLSIEGIKGTSVEYERLYDGTKTTEWLKEGLGESVARIREGLTGLTASEFKGTLTPDNHGFACLSDDNPENIFRVVGTEVVNGDKCIILKAGRPSPNPLSEERLETKTWVNVDKGFTVARMEGCVISNATDEVATKQVYINRVKQYGADLWGPAEHKMTQYDKDGCRVAELTLTYESDFQLNVPISEADLELVLPSGLRVYDEILDAEYVVP